MANGCVEISRSVGGQYDNLLESGVVAQLVNVFIPLMVSSQVLIHNNRGHPIGNLFKI